MGQLPLLAAIAIGGAAGALLRYGLLRGLGFSPRGFPIGTFTANVIGCLLLGFCIVWLTERASPTVRVGVQVGLIGALTTFSTYCFDSVDLARQHEFALAAVNTVLSVAVGLLAVWLGMRLGQWVTTG
jgi:CrcB protein